MKLSSDLSLPDAVLNQHMAVLGKTRSGKSSVMRLFVENLLGRGERVCVIDPKGDWWGLKSSADGKHAGFPVVIFGGSKADVPLNAHAGSSVAELVATGNRPCVIDLGGWMVGERTRFFIEFASTLFRATTAPLRLIIDEVHNFAPQGKVLDPDAGKMLHWANRLASEGAGKGIVILSASQRPQKVHKDFLTCAETLVAMRVIHPLDRGAIKEWIDGCPDPVKGKEVLTSLASMARGEGWLWSPEVGFGPKRVKFPLFETYDSFAAPTGQTEKPLKGWASVDLEDVKAKLVAVVEEAKANDPKELKRLIADLRKQLADKPASKADPAAVDKAVADAVAVRDREWQKSIREREAIIDSLRGRMNKAASLLHVNGEATPTIIPVPPKLITSPVKTSATVVPKTDYQPRKEPARGSVPAIAAGMPGLTARQQRFLNVAATLTILQAEVTREAICGWLGVHPRGGSVGEELKSLVEAGAITNERGRIVVTDAGLAAAETVYASEAIESAKSGLSHRQAKFFEVIVEAHPGEVTREEIASKFDLHPRGGSLGEDLGRLVGRGLVEASRGRYRARDFLFAGN